MFIDKDEGSIEIYELSGVYTIKTSSKKSHAVWTVHYKGYPDATLKWYNNNNEEIRDNLSEKYEIQTKKDKIILKINKPELKDNGKYKLKAFNDFVSTEKQFELIVNGESIEYS